MINVETIRHELDELEADEDLMILVEYDIGHASRSVFRWWQVAVSIDDRLFAVNAAGGRIPLNEETRIVERRKLKTDEKLDANDWRKTSLHVESFEDTSSGWMDRAGRIFPCHPEQHDQYARFILDRNVADLEREGWVRINTAPGKGSTYMYDFYFLGTSGLRLTAEQRNALSSHGYDVKDY